MRLMPSLCWLVLVCYSFPSSSFGQTSIQEVVRGPFLSAAVRGPQSLQTIATKGIVVTLGEEKNAFVCYDTDLARLSLAWRGGFLDFGDTQHQIAWPPPPMVKGIPMLGTKPEPGFRAGDAAADPRPRRQGPLPKEVAHYKGLFKHGDRVILSFTAGATAILEMPEFVTFGPGLGAFGRLFEIDPCDQLISISLCVLAGLPTNAMNQSLPIGETRLALFGENRRLAVGLALGPKESTLKVGRNDLSLQIPPHKEKIQCRVLVTPLADETAVEAFSSFVRSEAARSRFDLKALCQGGSAQWPETVVTKGSLGREEEAYVVDTITEPSPNPYRAEMFFGGFDFLEDGRAAISTFHGDVWIVSGIDDTLEKITWRRFATGLFQPLGVKVIRNRIYVLGRDQITLLRDLNNDGEADHYENFNNDSIVTANFHEFAMDLQADQEGNFYYARGAPWEPEVTTPHQGCILKVSADGARLEVFATGLRAPNGMAIGPNGDLTVSDNQGHWIPASKLILVEKNGFYGMTPTAQRELNLRWNGTNLTANPSNPVERQRAQLRTWGPMAAQPETCAQPLCWLPMNMDNSSGGQVWSGPRWGPLSDRLFFMSYGRCALFQVLLDQADGTRQAAMVQMPLKFQSGIMRGRVNPRDGQLYLCGLKGWQTSAVRNGGFYRVRYTGRVARLPDRFHATKDGVQLRFTCAVDPMTAGDPANYSVERWNYLWSGAYGSPDLSIDLPGQKGRDRLEVTRVHVSADGKSVLIETTNMKPADQIRIKYNIESADQQPLAHEVYATVFKLGAKAENF